MRQSLIKYLLDAEVELPSGTVIYGPVTTSDDSEYHFVNKSSELDFYVYLKKNENSWYKPNGQEIHTDQSILDQLGYQVDKFLKENIVLNKIDLT